MSVSLRARSCMTGAVAAERYRARMSDLPEKLIPARRDEGREPDSPDDVRSGMNICRFCSVCKPNPRRLGPPRTVTRRVLDVGFFPRSRAMLRAGDGTEESALQNLISGTMEFVLSNYFLTLFLVGLVFSLVGIARSPKPIGPAIVVEKLLAWHVFFVVGVAYFVNFIFHCFFGEVAAAFIGWADSPFQFEVATASLGFSLVGFIAAFRSFDLRLAAILGPSVFLLGAALGHIYQMITAHNFAPGNASLIFYMDILLPFFGLALLWFAKRNPR